MYYLLGRLGTEKKRSLCQLSDLCVNFKCEHFILHLTHHFHLALGTGWARAAGGRRAESEPVRHNLNAAAGSESRASD